MKRLGQCEGACGTLLCFVFVERQSRSWGQATEQRTQQAGKGAQKGTEE